MGTRQNGVRNSGAKSGRSQEIESKSREIAGKSREIAGKSREIPGNRGRYREIAGAKKKKNGD